MYPYRQKYIFYRSPSGEDHDIFPTPDDLYTPKRGYGFITEKNMQQPLLKFPEFNGGFMPLTWYRNAELTRIFQDECGCTVSEFDAGPENSLGTDKKRQIPLRFKCNVPSNGSYRLKVCIRAGEDISDLRIFTGRRVLCAWQPELSAGDVLSLELFTEVCGIIPRGEEKLIENRCIELSITASRPYISELEITELSPGECNTLYIAGDSTVTDQSADYPYAPETSYAGWGQMLPLFIKGPLAVSNHAHSGLTTESFRSEGHAAVPMARAKEGDYMLFQFAHNDQKLMHLKAGEGYYTNLENYVKECRRKKIAPILVTPVARNSWRENDGTYNDLLEEYAQAVLLLGKRLSVPVLDLHRLSMEFVKTRGRDGAKKYFFPSDYTHFNDFGACLMAEMICHEIIRVCEGADEPYSRLTDMLKKKAPHFPEPESIELPKCPDGFSAENDSPEFEEPDRPNDPLLRAEALDMVIRRTGFLMTNVYNDLFTDIVGHEWYAGTVECGLQNGIIDISFYKDRKFYPLEPVTLQDFISFLMMAYKSRRMLPAQEPTAYDDLPDSRLRPLISAACTLGLLAKDGTACLEQTITRSQGAAICRQLKIM